MHRSNSHHYIACWTSLMTGTICRSCLGGRNPARCSPTATWLLRQSETRRQSREQPLWVQLPAPQQNNLSELPTWCQTRQMPSRLLPRSGTATSGAGATRWLLRPRRPPPHPKWRPQAAAPPCNNKCHTRGLTASRVRPVSGQARPQVQLQRAVETLHLRASAFYRRSWLRCGFSHPSRSALACERHVTYI